MAQKINKHCMNVYEGIKKLIDLNTAEEFIKKYSLSGTSDYNKKLKWVKNVCTYLEENFTYEEVLKIRMKCSCNQSDTALEKIKKLYLNSSNLIEFCKKYNEIYSAHFVWLEGDDFYFSYPECYCSMVKRIDEPIPKTWCLCTLGYIKHRFAYVFHSNINIELIESIKCGGEKCIMKITNI